LNIFRKETINGFNAGVYAGKALEEKQKMQSSITFIMLGRFSSNCPGSRCKTIHDPGIFITFQINKQLQNNDSFIFLCSNMLFL
jgi:hypothetical protein